MVFIKDCIRTTVIAFGNIIILRINNIPLSRDTMRSRIIRIDCAIEEKLKLLLATCAYFSLCFDESTDVRHVNQINIFARIVQDNFSYTKKLLDFVSLHGTTTSIDIYKVLESTLKKFNYDFSKCSCIVELVRNLR